MKRYTRNEWKVMSAWIKKDFYCDFLHIGWEKVSYPGQFFERHVTKEIMMKDQYVLEIVVKFKITFYKAITMAVITILISTLNILYCFSDSFIENKRLQNQTQALKQQFLESEKELKSTIEGLKAELSTRPKIQPTSTTSPIRSTDLGDGRSSV